MSKQRTRDELDAGPKVSVNVPAQHDLPGSFAIKREVDGFHVRLASINAVEWWAPCGESVEVPVEVARIAYEIWSRAVDGEITRRPWFRP